MEGAERALNKTQCKASNSEIFYVSASRWGYLDFHEKRLYQHDLVNHQVSHSRREDVRFEMPLFLPPLLLAPHSRNMITVHVDAGSGCDDTARGFLQLLSWTIISWILAQPLWTSAATFTHDHFGGFCTHNLHRPGFLRLFPIPIW